MVTEEECLRTQKWRQQRDNEEEAKVLTIPINTVDRSFLDSRPGMMAEPEGQQLLCNFQSTIQTEGMIISISLHSFFFFFWSGST